jgi:transcriptional antiterminator NusG
MMLEVRGMDLEVDNYSSDYRWYAVWTRSRQEKVAASMLEYLEVPHFLPLKSETRQWSDRKQTVQVPLFSGYLFVRMDPSTDSRLQVLKTPGIAGLVGNHTGPLPIPDYQIRDIRTVLTQQVECSVLPLLHKGDRVRVVRGPLVGLEGRIIRNNSQSRLLISIELINRSLGVNISQQDVDLLDQDASG